MFRKNVNKETYFVISHQFMSLSAIMLVPIFKKITFENGFLTVDWNRPQQVKLYKQNRKIAIENLKKTNPFAKVFPVRPPTVFTCSYNLNNQILRIKCDLLGKTPYSRKKRSKEGQMETEVSQPNRPLNGEEELRIIRETVMDPNFLVFDN